ncbi:MAG: hypothetical protein RIS47_997 [Bacteroidota bacterium]|jgi:hypothetical protein
MVQEYIVWGIIAWATYRTAKGTFQLFNSKKSGGCAGGCGGNCQTKHGEESSTKPQLEYASLRFNPTDLAS